MPSPGRSKNGKVAHVRPETQGSQIDREYLARRTEAFQKALNRKGLPVTWGTGTLRTDEPFRLDMQYLAEDRGEA